MGSQINTCFYGTNPSSVNSLTDRKIQRLNTTGAYDIRARVTNIITKHLQFNGDDDYTLQLQKTKITFTCGGQTRTLEKQSNNQWKLRVGTTETSLQTPGELDHDLDDTLAKIRHLASETLSDEPSENSALKEQITKLQQTVDQLRSPPPQNTTSPQLLSQLDQHRQLLTEINHHIQALGNHPKPDPLLEERLRKLDATLDKLQHPPHDDQLQRSLETLTQAQQKNHEQLQQINQHLSDLRQENTTLPPFLETLQVTLQNLERQSATPPTSHSPEILTLLTQNQIETLKKLEEIHQAIRALQANTHSSKTEDMARNFQAYARQLEDNNARMYAHLETQQRTIAELKNQLEQLKSQQSPAPSSQPPVQLQETLDAMSRQLQNIQNHQMTTPVVTNPEIVIPEKKQPEDTTSQHRPFHMVHQKGKLLGPNPEKTQPNLTTAALSVTEELAKLFQENTPGEALLQAKEREKDLKLQLKQSQNNLRTLNAQLEENRSAAANTSKNLAQANRQIKILENTLSIQIDDNAETQVDLDLVNAHVIELTNELQTTKQSEQELKKALSENAETIATLTASGSEKDGRITQLKAEEKELQSKLDDKQNRLAELQTQLAQATLSQQESQKKIQEQTQQITDLNTQLAKAQNNLQQQQQAIAESSQKIDSLQNDLSQSNSQKQQLQTQLATTQSTLNTTTQKLEAAQAQIAALEQNLQEATIKANTLRSEFNQSQEKIKNLNTELTATQSTLERLQENLKERETHIEKLDTQMKKAATEASNAAMASAQNINKLSEANAKLNYEIKSLRGEMESLYGRLHRQEVRIKQLENQDSLDL